MPARNVFIWTASILVTGAAALGQAPTATPPVSGGNLGDKLEELGNRQADAATAGAVRTSLSQLLTAATAQGQFAQMIAGLSREDRDRIGAMPRENYDALDKAIQQLRQEFETRYHHPLAIKPEDLKDAEVTLGRAKGTVTVTLAPEPATDARSGEKTIQQKTGMAVVNGPTLTMINDGGQTPAWKADVPNEMSGRRLKETLTKHLQKVADEKAAWKDDANTTVRAIAVEVLRSLSDTTTVAEEGG